MPSKFERKLALTFALKLTLTIAVLFMIGAIGLYAYAYDLVGNGGEEMWEFVPWETARAWSAEQALSDKELALREAQLRVRPNADLREALQGRMVGRIALPAMAMGFFAVLKHSYNTTALQGPFCAFVLSDGVSKQDV